MKRNIIITAFLFFYLGGRGVAVFDGGYTGFPYQKRVLEE